MKIGDRAIDLDYPPFIIAEIGVNHDGSVDRAVELTDAARRAGADAVKLQLYRTDLLLSKAAKLAAYQQRSGADDPFRMLRALELSAEKMTPIVERAHRNGLAAIVSIFSVELVAEAERLPFDAYKTASPDIINRPLIEVMLATGKPLILSTGAATAKEVNRAAKWLGEHPYLLMHCVSGYPTPDENAALGGRIAMHNENPRALGYSDHTTSVDTGALAVAGGACLLEKHLTYDRNARGPDHAASLEPHDLAEYVRQAQRAGKMRGPIEKAVSEIEHDVWNLSRQSLTSMRDLPAGHKLKRNDLTAKRPGTGLSPARLDEVIGRKLARAIEADMPLTEDHLA
jgi:N-acetylneuraminate synthase/N,N'-diacetyllegionaminate synthase